MTMTRRWQEGDTHSVNYNADGETHSVETINDNDTNTQCQLIYDVEGDTDSVETAYVIDYDDDKKGTRRIF